MKIVLVLMGKQRAYWYWPDGSRPTRDTTAARVRRTRMLE